MGRGTTSAEVTTVERLPHSISRTDVANWVDELYVRLDSRGRCLRRDSSRPLLTACMKEGVGFRNYDFDRAQGGTRCIYLFKRFSKKSKATVAVVRSGFDLVRPTNHENDPVVIEST